MGKGSSRQFPPRKVGYSRKRGRENKNEQEAKKIKKGPGFGNDVIDLTHDAEVGEERSADFKLNSLAAQSSSETFEIKSEDGITSTPNERKNLGTVFDNTIAEIKEKAQPSISKFLKTNLDKSFENAKEEMNVRAKMVTECGQSEKSTSDVSANGNDSDFLIHQPHSEFDEDFDSDADVDFLCDVMFDDSSLESVPVDPFDKPVQFHLGFRPHEFFRFFLDDEIVNTIVNETNAYAETLLMKESINEWKPIDKNEFLVFVALLLHTGTMRNLNILNHWGDHIEMDTFEKTMSKNRFVLIAKCLHFAPNDPKEDPFYKITPLVDHFNKKCSTMFQMFPSDFVYEGFMFYRQNSIKYYSGINLTMILKPKTNIVANFTVHGSTGIQKEHDPSEGHFMDHALKRWPEKDQEHNIAHFSMQWRQKNTSGNTTFDFTKISLYYPCSMKVKWYKTIAFHLFHIMLYNAFHLYSMKYKMKYNEFRMNVINYLLKLPNVNRPKSLGRYHFPSKISVQGKKRQGVCINCKENHMKERRTEYECRGCDKTPLCIDCFQEYHELLCKN